jgi:ubiquinone/menaquinone biosynthesis C-methylase UbiE
MAWFMAREGGRYDSMVEDRKRELFSRLSGTVVELGTGTGPNLRHLPEGLRFVAVEPNPHMYGHLFKEAEAREQEVTVVTADAHALPFQDGSVDAVLSTLVLCSVGGLDRVLREVHRILKPGGRFIFIEHVGAPEGSWLRRFQRWVRPVWTLVGDGCEPDRDTERTLRGAGFASLRVERFTLPILLVSPHIAGVAEK